jgi:hypothetical protein
MANDERTIGSKDFKDRKVGLIIFGIVEICLGAFCALMVPLMIFALLMVSTLGRGTAPPVRLSMMIPALLIYLLLAVWFIWMGIGSIQARRWARALWLVCSWLGLISGVCGLLFMLVLMPDMYGQMSKNGQIPESVAVAMKYSMAGFMFFFYVILPGVFILFYGSRNVKATCEFRDPKLRWTDRCPLPVLAVSLISGFSAVCMPVIGFYGWAIPFFGFVLSGLAGAGVASAITILLGYVAWGTYRLNIKAWWCAVALVVALGASGSITFWRVSLMEFYEKMNFPAEQLIIMKQFDLSQSHWMVPFFLLWVIVALGWLSYTKRYFGRPFAEPGASTGEAM